MEVGAKERKKRRKIEFQWKAPYGSRKGSEDWGRRWVGLEHAERI